MSESSPGERLNSLLEESGLEPLPLPVTACFESYLSLLLRWNSRINLTAIRDTETILSRHFLESIACARALPEGITTLLDFGSGGGFPGIPIALCSPEIAVTLAESQGKKAAFLREAVRTLGISTKVHSARAEQLSGHFDCVILRAVDKMASAVESAAKLVGPGSWLALMTTESELEQLNQLLSKPLSWQNLHHLPGEHRRLLALAHPNISSPA